MPFFRESSISSKILDHHASRRSVRALSRILGDLLVGILLIGALFTGTSSLDAQPGTGPGGVGDTSTPSALTLWLESGTGAFSDIGCTTAATDTSSVACWADQSGNGHNATQSLVVRQPIYRTNILNATHGQSVLRFDGVDDFLITTAVPATGSAARTLVAVINNGTDNGLNYQHIAHYGSNAFRRAYGLCFRTNPNQTAGAGSNIGNHYWANGFSSNLARTTSPLILAIQYNGTVDELFADGSTQGTKTVNLNTNSTDGLRIASRVNATEGAEFFAGDVAELIAYGTLLTTPQRILIENYLSAKFATTLTANDKYAGDTVGNGDYDHQVAGIGRDSGSSHSAGVSAGLFLTDDGFLQDNGDYLLAGHDSPSNSVVNTDVPAGVTARSQRVWYLAVTDVSSNGGAVELTFDFARAGLGSLPSGSQDFHLLARSATSGDFTSIATSTDTSGDQVTFPLADVATDLVPDGPYLTVGFTPNVDLAITKSNGQSTVAAGTQVTYTLQVTNNGSDPVTGATVTDTFPASLSSISWTCTPSAGSTCTGAGGGNLSDTVDLLAGGVLTYSVTATLALTATGDLVNTATVAPPMGTVDPISENDSATDTDSIVPAVDLAVTKTDGVVLVDEGDELTYTITVSYPSGAITAESVTVTDTFPSSLTCSWTCVASGGATCTAGPVAGNLVDSVDLPVASSVTYTAVCTIALGTTGVLTNTATATVPAGTQDPQPGNNSATDVDLLHIVFNDNFESGNTSAWTVAVGTAAPVTFDLTRPYSAFRAAFYLDSEALEGMAIEALELLSGFAARDEQLFALEWRRHGDASQIRLRLADDGGTWHASAWHWVPTPDPLFELEWLRAPHAQSIAGALRLTVDGLPELELNFINNHQRGVQQLRAGEWLDANPVLVWESVELE